ncbi:MAG: hypothetical protein RBR45_14445, partial [Pseudomonas sp.]|nr:hypothetical protein [Pseudomonas sp.]
MITTPQMSVLVCVFGYFKTGSKVIESVEYEKSPHLSSVNQPLQEGRPVQQTLIKPSPPAAESQSPKQTVFNDDNYQPKGLVNSITP